MYKEGFSSSISINSSDWSIALREDFEDTKSISQVLTKENQTKTDSSLKPWIDLWSIKRNEARKVIVSNVFLRLNLKILHYLETQIRFLSKVNSLLKILKIFEIIMKITAMIQR